MNLDEAAVFSILQRVDGFLLPGGGDINPKVYGEETIYSNVSGVDDMRDALEFKMVKTVIDEQIPFLAICRGHQVLNVALGGTLWQDIATDMPEAVRHDNYGQFPRNYLAHPIRITRDDSLLAQQLQTTSISVNSLHHQAIRDLADGLTVTAVAPDGLIEAVEVSGHPFALAVQWHPEHLVKDDPAMQKLFKGLVDAAQA